MTFRSNPYARWLEGPYAMKAIIGCAIENKPGEWFVQLRIPSDDLFDQHVISNAWGGTREQTIENARLAGKCDEVIPWSGPVMTPKGVFYPRHDLLAVMRRCGEAIEALCGTIGKRNGI